MSFIGELKRRNVFKVGIAYAVATWVLLQVTDVITEILSLPEWTPRLIFLILLVGLVPALIFAWAFELTPEGIKREKYVDRSDSITPGTGRKLDYTIIGLLALGMTYFIWESRFQDDEAIPATTGPASIAHAESAEPPGNETPGNGQVAGNSIAVLPFVNMSSDKEQEYFSDGLSEELLNLLAKIPELRVAARTSSFSFKGQNIEIPQIALRLKVAHVLEGSVRKSGQQIRITAQLVQADNGFHLWSETYDRQLDNIFQIQDEIAAAVVDALKVTLLGHAPRVKKTDPEAYQLFLEGQYYSRQLTEVSIPKAVGLFKKAVEIDPGYSPAWAELAYAYLWYSGTGSLPIEEGNDLADQAIEIALSTDPDNARAFLVRGMSRLHNKFDFKAGVKDLGHALQLDPGNAALIAATGTGAISMGRLDEAIRQYQAALELDPIMPEFNSYLGLTHLYAGHLDAAEASNRKTLELSPKITGGHYRLGRVLIRQGSLAEAQAEIEQETSLIYRLTGLAMVHHALDKHEESQQALDDLIENGASGAAYQIAEVYGFRQEIDKAFEWLEQSLVIRDSGLASILGNPALRDLRTDPRWPPFLEKLGLAEFWLEMPVEYGGPLE